MKVSIPPTKCAVTVSSLSEYSKECLQLKRYYLNEEQREERSSCTQDFVDEQVLWASEKPTSRQD